MKQTKIQPIITLQGLKYIRLVLVCAWCPKVSHTPLRENEEYTHGICKTHEREVMGQLKSRKSFSEDRSETQTYYKSQ